MTAVGHADLHISDALHRDACVGFKLLSPAVCVIDTLPAEHASYAYTMQDRR